MYWILELSLGTVRVSNLHMLRRGQCFAALELELMLTRFLRERAFEYSAPDGNRCPC